MSVELSEVKLDEIDFQTQLAFFDDLEHLNLSISDLSKVQPNQNTSFLLHSLSFWCDNRWDELVEASLPPVIQGLLFQIIPENYAKYSPEMQGSIGAAQASMFIRNQEIPDFWEWLLAQQKPLIVNFLVNFSNKLIVEAPNNLEAITALKNGLNESGVAAHLGAFALSLATEDPTTMFSITDSLASWSEPSWILNEANMQVIVSWLSNAFTFQHALLLIQSAISHSELENRNSIFTQVLGVEGLDSIMRGLGFEPCTFAAADFMYNIFNLLSPEERAPIYEWAKAIVLEYPHATHKILRIIAIDPLSHDTPENAFAVAWNAFLGMAASLTIDSLGAFFEGETLVGKIVFTTYDADKEKFNALTTEAFSSIDPLSNPQRTLCQISLLRLLRHGGIKWKPEDEVCSSFVELCNAEPTAIAESPAATCALINLFKYAYTNQKPFNPHRETLMTSFIRFILESGAPEASLEPFEAFLPEFLGSYATAFQWSTEALAALIDGLDPIRIKAAGIAIAKYESVIGESNADEMKSELLQAINESIEETDPVPGLIGLLNFSVACNGFGAAEVLEPSMAFTEVDELCYLIIELFRYSSENIFEDLRARYGEINGTKTLAACFNCLTWIAKNRANLAPPNEEIDAFLAESFSELIPLAHNILSMAIEGIVSEEDSISLIKEISSLIGSSYTFLPAELISGIAEWIIPLVISSSNRPNLFSAIRSTAETIVFCAKEYVPAFIRVSFAFALSPSFDPNSVFYRVLINDALYGIRKNKIKDAEAFHAALNEACSLIGFLPEEAEEMAEIFTMRINPASDRACVLFREFKKHSCPIY